MKRHFYNMSYGTATVDHQCFCVMLPYDATTMIVGAPQGTLGCCRDTNEDIKLYILTTLSYGGHNGAVGHRRGILDTSATTKIVRS